MIVTVGEVRAYLQDLSAADNELMQGFTNEQILNAMKAAAREYNSVPPVTMRVSYDSLPGDTNIFFDGIAMHLYRARLAMLMRNDIAYEDGGVKTTPAKSLIAHLEKNIPYYRDRFLEAARDLKRTCNYRQFYGIVSPSYIRTGRMR